LGDSSSHELGLADLPARSWYTVRISYVDQIRAHIDPDRPAWELVSDAGAVLRIGSVEVPSRAYLAAFGFKGPDQQKPARLFSGGERNRLNLALTLKQGGNVLLLDEPTNELDTETLGSLENAILDFAGCVVVTAHNRWFLDRVATHILAWEGTDRDPGRWYWFEGNFAGYEQGKIERLGPEASRAAHTRARGVRPARARRGSAPDQAPGSDPRTRTLRTWPRATRSRSPRARRASGRRPPFRGRRRGRQQSG
jgi:hypothetical protein